VKRKRGRKRIAAAAGSSDAAAAGSSDAAAALNADDRAMRMRRFRRALRVSVPEAAAMAGLPCDEWARFESGRQAQIEDALDSLMARWPQL